MPSDRCDICNNQLHYGPPDDRRVRNFGCSHVFHVYCLRRTTKRCPLCRAIEIGKKVVMYTGGAAVGALLAPIVATTALGFIGFSAAGPVAGSLAAILHSHIGNVAAGSLFALCQSIAMGGHLPAIGYAAGAAVGGAAAGIVAETHSGHEYGVSRNSDEGKGVSQHVQQR